MGNREGIYNAPKELGWGKTIVLGLQHIFAMFGATVLVPLLTGLSVQVTLLCAGVGTLLFQLVTKGKVPAFLGSSFAFLAGYFTITAFDFGKFETMEMAEKLQYAGGGVVIAGLVYLVMAGLISAVGIKKVLRYVPPIVTGPIIILIGLNLAGSAVSNIVTVPEGSATTLAQNWILAAVAIVTIIVCNIWGRGMIKIIPILMGVVVSYIVAVIMGAVDFGAIAGQNIVGLPPFALAKFDASAIIIMAPIALATMMEHIGDVSAISATVGTNFIKDPGLHRTLLGDGLATSLAGLVGGPANTTYGENTGVLALSRVYDPRVIRIAAIGAVVLSFSPMFDMVVRTIPSPIVGGVSFILYGMISAIGVRNIVENRIDMMKSRNLIIAAIVLVSGLGFQAYPIEFTVGEATLSFGGLACAAIFGIVLNAVLPGKDEAADGSDEKVPVMELGAELPEEHK